MSDVQLADIRKVYPGGFEAVKGVSIEIADGAFCVLVGPSGCGKSTLLRMVAGLETISGGIVKIGGKPVNALEPAERDIAMVFQNYALYPHMSVYDNMAYGLRNLGTPKAEIEARVTEAARILDIEALLDRRPKALSGGQRQRVAMGRAIVRKPKVFLFDEPLSNLDAKLRIQMRVEIKKLQRALKTTAIYVTHDQLEAMTLADILVVMNRGRIEQTGAPLELYERPATLFVAGFIGAPPMNLLRLPPEGLPGLSLSRPPAQACVLGIRPEHLRVVETRPAEAAFSIAMDVFAIEAVGAETYLYGTIGDTAGAKGGQDLILRVAGKTQIPVGARVLATAREEALHFFDPSSGERLN